ncbi:hypothetical protein GCM10020256_28520 [Streptomyces thermocoprophilus]
MPADAGQLPAGAARVTAGTARPDARVREVTRAVSAPADKRLGDPALAELVQTRRIPLGSAEG